MGVVLRGKVAVVTGADSGLGGVYARALAEVGAKVVVNGCGGMGNGTSCNTTVAGIVEEITAKGGTAVADHNTVTTKEGAEGIFRTTEESFGGVDILVNNAGIVRDRILFHRMTVEEWDAVMAVHLRGTFLVTRAVWSHMKRQGNGVVINTSTASILDGRIGQANYGAVEGGIWALSAALAREGSRRGGAEPTIRIFTLAQSPALEASDQVDPELASPMLIFLASDFSRRMTGRIFSITDEGRIAEMSMVTAPGVVSTEALGPWTPQAIASQMHNILLQPLLGEPRVGNNGVEDSLEERIRDQMQRAGGSAYSLSVRELTVLYHLSRGKSNKEIAGDLGISVFTTNKHVSNILAKMDSRSRTEASTRAIYENLLP